MGGAQEAVGERFVFSEQAEQQVLGLDIGTTKLAGFVATKENHPTRLLRVPFEHGPSVMPSPRRQYNTDTPLTVVDRSGRLAPPRGLASARTPGADQRIQLESNNAKSKKEVGPMYAITGASGNTGSVIAEKLLERGE